ncbi:MAG: PilZ domain-containing protein [Alphaproteobacteria bacterium]|nr:PilZ domain-containing protein [Alphaproteobacteria bacterium]
MFAGFFSSLIAQNNNVSEAARRRHQRRNCDQCVTIINGRIYPVDNWSLGGAQIIADERNFSLEEEINIILKFKLSEDVIEVPHSARVVRKGRSKVSFAFRPLTQKTHSSFQHVIDDYVTSQFAASQRPV